MTVDTIWVDEAWVPKLDAHGLDKLLDRLAAQGMTLESLAQTINDQYDTNNKFPFLDGQMLFRYMADRLNAGHDYDAELIFAGGESLPSATTRPDAPTLSRSGTTITIESPTNNPYGATTTLRVYSEPGMRIQAEADRDLTQPDQRQVDISSWGLNGDENIYVTILDDNGVVGWFGKINLSD